MGRIVWLASYPKSGNTWTRAFLHNLLAGGDGPWDINQLDTLTANEAATDNFRAFDARPWSAWSADDVAAMRPAAQEALAASRPHMIFCKTHLAVMSVAGHPTVNMAVTAGAVYLVRNPLDIVPSFADFQAVGIDETIEILNLDSYTTPTTETRVAEPMGSWSQNVESWTARPSPGLHVMRYEDMLANPLKAFTSLVRFLKIDMPAGRIRAAVRHSSFRELRRQEEKRGFREKAQVQKHFFRSGRKDVWKRELSEAQVAAVVDRNREQMARFGYVPEGF